ncbi:MAG: hypothetical protein JST82_10390 [Bacteroidetes bacterium]|nr:hypothetical protein [Bacteroidota bacterium]
MEAAIVKKLYEAKYKPFLSFEIYNELLQKGLELVRQDALRKKCNPTEQKALEIGLDYITASTL